MRIDSRNDFDNRLDVVIWWGIAALLALLMFSTALGQALLVLLILLGLFKIIKEKKIYLVKNTITLAFSVFVGIRIFSIILSEYPGLSINSLNKEIFFYLIFFVFLISLHKYDDKKFRLLIQILVFAAIIAAAVGSTKVFLGIEERAKSTTSGYSTLGLFLSVIFAMVFSLGKSKIFFPSRIWWFFTLLIIATGILFTFNRSNWLAVGIITLVIGLYKERIIFGVFLVLCILTIILIPNLSDRLDQLIHFTHHLSDRDVIWRGAFMLWDQHPVFGFGTRTFHEIFPLYNQLADKGVGGWHNEFLHIYMESGLLGLFSYVWIMVSIFYSGLRLIKHHYAEKINFDLALAILAGLSMFYLNSLTGGFILDPISKVLFMFILALAATTFNLQLAKAVSAN